MSCPTVTIAIPVLNEEGSIQECLDAVDRQTYPEIIEILVVDGGSSDATRQIAAGCPKVRVLDNPGRHQASGLNVALFDARGEVFVRVDSHAFLAPDYVERCVEVLQATGAAMVGGPMRPVGRTWFGRAVAIALSSPFGAGPARFHTGGQWSGFTDTVYLGAYRTADAREIGGYTPVAVNEDAEFAIRLGKRRGVWLDTSIRSTYASRESLTALARQFFRYGRGRATTILRHPRSLSGRQLAAPALLIMFLLPFRWRIMRVYLIGLILAAVHAGKREPEVIPGVALAMVTMHLCWGAGFWFGLLASVETRMCDWAVELAAARPTGITRRRVL